MILSSWFKRLSREYQSPVPSQRAATGSRRSRIQVEYLEERNLLSYYSSAVLALSPIAYYRLGESSGTTAADSSGNGLNGTYNGGVTLGQPGGIFGDPDTAG